MERRRSRVDRCVADTWRVAFEPVMGSGRIEACSREINLKLKATANRDLLSDQIRNLLTDEIAAGGLAAGSALDEQQLADRFGASRTPVREALRQLAVSGLVEIRPRRGVVVTRLTPERIMEMFETTAEVEAMCVRLATYRVTPLERSERRWRDRQIARRVEACETIAELAKEYGVLPRTVERWARRGSR